MSDLSSFDSKEIQILGEVIASSLKTDLTALTTSINNLSDRVIDLEKDVASIANSLQNNKDNLDELKLIVEKVERSHDQHVKVLYEQIDGVEDKLVAFKETISKDYLSKENLTMAVVGAFFLITSSISLLAYTYNSHVSDTKDEFRKVYKLIDGETQLRYTSDDAKRDMRYIEKIFSEHSHKDMKP